MRRPITWMVLTLSLLPLFALSCGEEESTKSSRVADARFAFIPVTPDDSGTFIKGKIGDVNRQGIPVSGRAPVEFFLAGAQDRVRGEFEADGTRNVMATLELDGQVVARQYMKDTGGKIVLDSVIPTDRHEEK